MSTDRIVKIGEYAWQPRPDASDLEVLHSYDVPLFGTFRVESSPIAFMCVVGDPGERATYWVYVPISQDDAVKVLETEFRDLTDMYVWLEARASGHEVVIAQTDSSLKISQWGPVNVPAGGSLYGAASKYLETALQYIQGVRRDIERFLEVRDAVASAPTGHELTPA